MIEERSELIGALFLVWQEGYPADENGLRRCADAGTKILWR